MNFSKVCNCEDISAKDVSHEIEAFRTDTFNEK